MKSRFDNNFYKYISEAKEYDDSRLIDLKSQYEGKEQITIQDIADLLNVAIADEFLAAFNYFSSFILSMWYITFIDLPELNHPCDPRVKPVDHGV